MKIQELRNIGRNKLAENNVDDVFIKIDILLQHLLKINKTELIINQENEAGFRIIGKLSLVINKR